MLCQLWGGGECREWEVYWFNGLLFDGFDVDFCEVEGEFFSAFWAVSVESLYDFVWWG